VSERRWFHYSAAHGMMIHGEMLDALAAAENLITEYEGEAQNTGSYDEDILTVRWGLVIGQVRNFATEESVPPVYSCDAKFKLLRSTENLWYQAGKEDALGVLGGEIARLNKRIEEYRAEGFYRESAELGGTKEMLLQLCQRIKDIPGVS
jgi:hypothetical protein